VSRGTAVVAALALALCSGAGWAAARDASVAWTTGSEPLQVDSSSMEARGTEGQVLFEGDVVARQGDLTLQSDRLDVTLDPQTRALRTVVARGHVRIQKGDVVATAGDATYDAATGIVVLTGEPRVRRGEDVVAGGRITLHLAENRSVVEGAKAIFFPGKPSGQGP